MRHPHWRWQTRSALFPVEELPLPGDSPDRRQIRAIGWLRCRMYFLLSLSLRTPPLSGNLPFCNKPDLVHGTALASRVVCLGVRSIRRGLHHTCPVAEAIATFRIRDSVTWKKIWLAVQARLVQVQRTRALGLDVPIVRPMLSRRRTLAYQPRADRLA